MATAANTVNIALEQTVNGYSGTYTESLAAAGNGSTIMIPSGTRYLAASALATGGATAKLQATLDSHTVIDANTESYFDWPDGEVTSETDMAINPAVTAIRIVQTGAGASTIKVRVII